jgi:uncharacterized integral membrane protein
MTNWLRNVLRLVVIAPLAVIFLSFNMANRQNVVIAFDPFNSTDAALPQIELPLYAVLIGAVMLGVLLGGVAVWLRQGRFRKAARDGKLATAALRAENDALRGQVATLKGASAPATGSALALRRGAA